MTAKHDDVTPASLQDVYSTMLHEMGGHALGLMGHSPNEIDLMYGYLNPDNGELTDRDRETLWRIYAKPSGSRVVGARKAERR